MTITDYDAMFEELSQFCPHYNGVKLKDLSALNSRARSSHYKSISDKRSGNQNHNKTYDVKDSKGKQRFQPKTIGVKTQSGGGALTPVRCFKCEKPKKIADTKVQGKAFALNGADASDSDNIIRGTSFINGIPLVAIIDMGATNSFISTNYVKRLNLEVSSMNGHMVIDTPANGSVTTTMGCLHCHVTVYDRDFMIDLVCLPLSQLDIILGMNWLTFNHIYINCYNKSVVFPEFVVEEDSMFISSSQVGKFLKGEEKVFSMLSSLKLEKEEVIGNLQVVCDFPYVFPNDISDLPPEREVEFIIDLVPGTRPVSMAP
ncbi:uncharacterized protein LOC127137256 [Lathyrus oleraceus]|uniref:uncharacterized protein LOC127137256 n=1 Tax=Pisum sativum TaxID=3888 RepID=UPI0021CF554D|nr:uncharacterized protein LOC127137256 [Pisum sativum]